MTQKDESPNASEGPYWSEELLAVLVVGLGDETQARETLEGIIQQALSGRALQGISEEALASYLFKLYERIAESVQDSDVARRRSLTKKVEVVTEAASRTSCLKMRTGCCCCCCCCSCCLCRCLGLLSAKLLRLLQLRCSPSVTSFFHSQNVVLKNTGCNCAALRPPLVSFTHRRLC